MLKCAGRFLYIRLTAAIIPFGKDYTKPQDLASLLVSRGLTIKDTNKTEHYLEHIGYYRLSAYMYPLLKTPKSQHLYKRGASFEKVMMLYRFDKKLRLFLFNEIEKIEVAIRSSIVNIGSEMIGEPFWMTDASNFTNSAKFSKTMDLIDNELRKSREDFIVHFKSTYSTTCLDSIGDIAFWHYNKHLRQYQEQEDQEAYLPFLWSSNRPFRIVAYYCYSY